MSQNIEGLLVRLFSYLLEENLDPKERILQTQASCEEEHGKKDN